MRSTQRPKWAGGNEREGREGGWHKASQEAKGKDKKRNPLAMVDSGAEAFSRESLRLFWANRVLPSGKLEW